MRRRAKVDGNHEEIANAFRARGYLVLSLAALGRGVPDLLVLEPAGRRFRLVEVKQPKGKLTEDQQRFQQAGWPVTIVRTVEEALTL